MQPEALHKTSDVYGINRDLPLNYVARSSVDEALVNNLTRDRHLVIYGSSKQGKTSLRKHCLDENDYIVVHCSNKWSVGDLNSAILKRAGYEVTQSSTKSSSGKYKVIAYFKAKILGTETGLQGERESENSTQVVKAPLELDPEDVNDIISALNGFNKYIVLGMV